MKTALDRSGGAHRSTTKRRLTKRATSSRSTPCEVGIIKRLLQSAKPIDLHFETCWKSLLDMEHYKEPVVEPQAVVPSEGRLARLRTLGANMRGGASHRLSSNLRISKKLCNATSRESLADAALLTLSQEKNAHASNNSDQSQWSSEMEGTDRTATTTKPRRFATSGELFHHRELQQDKAHSQTEPSARGRRGAELPGTSPESRRGRASTPTSMN